MEKNKNNPQKETADDSISQPLTPAVPPADDPLRRAQGFDPDREYKSREMAEKRLEAIRKTREMPTANEEAAANQSEKETSDGKSDPT
jgi:hypothetical protein